MAPLSPGSPSVAERPGLSPLSVPPQYYAECHGVIYVIDSTDEERLSESKRAFGGCSLGGWEVLRSSVYPTFLGLGSIGAPRVGGAVRCVKGTHCPRPIPEKMVLSETLDGVPILVLANKQDVQVSLPKLPQHRGILGAGPPPGTPAAPSEASPALQVLSTEVAPSPSQQPWPGWCSLQGGLWGDSSEGERPRDLGHWSATPQAWLSAFGTCVHG